MSQPCDLISTAMPFSAQYFVTASTKVRWLLSIFSHSVPAMGGYPCCGKIAVPQLIGSRTPVSAS
jgi:hypothetical protein